MFKTEIKPKYQVGEKVWVIDENKAVEKTVQGVLVIDNKYNPVRYFLDYKDSIRDYGWTYENEVFVDKKSLIDSL